LEDDYRWRNVISQKKTIRGKSYRCHLDVYAFLVVGILKLKQKKMAYRKEGRLVSLQKGTWNQSNCLSRNFCPSCPIPFFPSANSNCSFKWSRIIPTRRENRISKWQSGRRNFHLSTRYIVAGRSVLTKAMQIHAFFIDLIKTICLY
jgi:hypothetical protein